MSGWGTGPFGIGPWGGVTPGPGLSLVSALAISTNQVQVIVSAQPRHSSPAGTGDALNPIVWSVQRLDTLDFLDVISVAEIDPLTYVLTTLQPFGPVSTIHRVASTTMVDLVGALIHIPTTADFAGILAKAITTPVEILASQRLIVQDIHNPQSPLGPFASAGTLRITSGGDYQSVAGVELTRKLVLRRLVTSVNGFFHLPRYGAGIVELVKTPIPPSELVKLRAQVEAQVSKEPEIDSVTATLSLSTDGVLVVLVDGIDKLTGSPISVGLQAGPNGAAVLGA